MPAVLQTYRLERRVTPAPHRFTSARLLLLQVDQPDRLDRVREHEAGERLGQVHLLQVRDREREHLVRRAAAVAGRVAVDVDRHQPRVPGVAEVLRDEVDARRGRLVRLQHLERLVGGPRQEDRPEELVLLAVEVEDLDGRQSGLGGDEARVDGEGAHDGLAAHLVQHADEEERGVPVPVRADVEAGDGRDGGLPAEERLQVNTSRYVNREGNGVETPPTNSASNHFLGAGPVRSILHLAFTGSVAGQAFWRFWTMEVAM